MMIFVNTGNTIACCYPITSHCSDGDDEAGTIKNSFSVLSAL